MPNTTNPPTDPATPPAPAPSPANMPPKKETAPVAPPSREEPIRVPEDHPLVRALAAQKAANAALREQLTGATSKDDGLQQQIQELQATIQAEKDARQAAEKAATDAAIAKLRAERVAEHRVNPEAAARLVKVLTGTDQESIDAEINDWLPVLGGTGVPLPNPQQGTPPGPTVGSVSAGQARYAERVASK